jgi:glycosyltransferase involved in cell wall biosynthesis
MRILFIVPEGDLPSTLNRVFLFVPYLESQGAEVEVGVFPKESPERRRLFDRVGEFDVVILQKRLLRRGLFRRLRRRARKLVFDFDDAILFRDSTASSPHSLTRRFRFRRIVRESDAVWVSNRYLAGLTEPFVFDPAKIQVFPTVINLDEYPPKNYRDKGAKDPVVLGWMGGAGNLMYLEDLKPVFEEVAGSCPNTVLRIVSQKLFALRNMAVDRAPYSEDRHIRDLQSFDVGLSPLRDDHWCRGKMPLKTLTYYGVQIPVVGSPVGSNPEIIQEGKTGFTPTTHQEWVEALCYLIDRPEERERMGFAGRERVAERFSLQIMAPRMWDSLQQIAKS